MGEQGATDEPETFQSTVLKPSVDLTDSSYPRVRGIDFNDHQDAPISVESLVEGMAKSGFQATSVAEAVRIIDNMIQWRDPCGDQHARTTILLGYTSNLVSSGLREVIRYLVQHRHVSAIVTTAGGVEEDIIKCLGSTHLGAFNLSGAALRDDGLNRIGNLLVPNNNYVKFEEWVHPIFDRLLEEQETARTKAFDANRSSSDDLDYQAPFVWTPSTVIARLGAELNDDESILTWASRNSIPIFCPALTDGSLGDMLWSHSYKAAPRELTIDLVRDIRKINDLAMRASRAGMIILGGGVVKHHVANACLMRDGAEHAVYINTAQEFDGSDAGARPDEAVSWGKIKSGSDAESVKVFAEATVVFPMIVAATFVKHDRLKRKPHDTNSD
ncbi:MAG: hypothetical protein Q9159_006802 [Coniocarpon cinnabarinum]